MAFPAEKSEQSMEDILASIRKIISEEDETPPLSASSRLGEGPEEEDVLPLTRLVQDNGNVVQLNPNALKPNPEDSMTTTTTSEAAQELDATVMDESLEEETLLLEEESSTEGEIETTVETVEATASMPPLKNLSAIEDISAIENVVSDRALNQAADALSSLSRLQAARASIATPADPVGGQTVENLMREVLRPLLRDWLDANLPSMVRVVVNEQVERIVRQMGHNVSATSEEEKAS